MTVGEGEGEGEGEGKRERLTRKILQHASTTTLYHTYIGVREESEVKDKGVMTSNMLQTVAKSRCGRAARSV